MKLGKANFTTTLRNNASLCLNLKIFSAFLCASAVNELKSSNRRDAEERRDYAEKKLRHYPTLGLIRIPGYFYPHSISASPEAQKKGITL